MMRPSSFRFSLLISVAGIMALAACDTSNLADKISGHEGRKEQMVDGPRRSPLLNPQGAVVPESTPSAGAPAMPAAQPSAKAAPAADSPFDQFDNEGRMVAAQPAKPLEMTSEADEEGAGSVSSGFFDRFIPSQPDANPAQKEKGAEGLQRKPFIGNEMVESAPPSQPAQIKPEPVQLAKPVEPKPAPVFVSAKTPAPAVIVPPASDERDSVSGFVPLLAEPASDVPSAPTPAIAKTEPAPQSAPTPVKDDGEIAQETASRPSFLSRLIAPITGAEALRAEDKPAPVAATIGGGSTAAPESYPALSSVPPTPESFKDVKADRDDTIAALKMDHALAQENKEATQAEPSELTPPSALLATKPIIPAAPPPIPAEPVVAASTDDQKPVLLGRISDPKLAINGEEPLTQEKPAPVQYREDKIVEAPKAAPAVIPAATAEPVKQEPAPDSAPWWKRLGDRFSSEPEQVPAAVVTTTKPRAIMLDEPSQTVEPFKPLLDTPAAPAKVTATSETNDEAEAAAPTPSQSDDVKTLPPSRYTPPRQRNYYLVP